MVHINFQQEKKIIYFVQSLFVYLSFVFICFVKNKKSSKKGYTYSYLKQNVVTLSSTTLQQHNSKQSISPLANQSNPSENTNTNTNSIENFAGRSASSTILANLNSDIDKLQQTTAFRSHSTKSKSFSSTTLTTSNANNADIDTKSISSRKSFQYEIVDKPIALMMTNKQNQRINVASPVSQVNSTPTNTVNMRSASTASITSSVLNYLQYGDVLIKCNSLTPK